MAKSVIRVFSSDRTYIKDIKRVVRFVPPFYGEGYIRYQNKETVVFPALYINGVFDLYLV